jgi:hypothetical protein
MTCKSSTIGASIFYSFAVTLAACTAAGCVSAGPSDWSPLNHMQVMRQCRNLCHPHGVRKYDPMDGSCACAAPRAGDDQ